ncbi:hypothetical protein D3Z52_03105 [Clostridiaceae bacterium]|nr:hypothetical protein [Clostridiaceae bacterium]NBH77170.1 hypothetical protein [Clostridiaceae bacterium]
MKKNLLPSAPLAAAIAAALIVGMLILSYLVSSGFYGAGNEPPPLPAATPEDGAADGADGLQEISGIEITPANVQAVIGALERASHYTQSVTNTLYYDGKSSIQTVTQYMRDGVCRTDVVRGGTVSESCLRAGDSFYAWQPGASGTVFRGAAGDFTADSMAMLPDWQTVTLLPPEAIVSASSVTANGEPVLLVTSSEGARVVEYEISTITGLLTSARWYDGDELTRELRVTIVSTDEPDASHFTLPDGTSVLPASPP